MSNRFRNNRREERDNKREGFVQADTEAVTARRHETRPTAPRWEWITERDAVEAACLDILHGKPGLYPIFGIQLAVELRDNRDGTYPVLVYCDAKYGDEGQGLFGVITPGFSMTPMQLVWGIKPDGKWKSDEHELLTRTLLGQPEMQLARDTFFREREAAEQEAAERERREIANRRSSLLEKLRSSPAAPVPEKRPSPPKLSELKQILTETWGTFETDGLTVLVCRAPKGDLTVVRIRDVPHDHPMRRVAEANVYARQDTLTYSDDLPNDKERNELQQLSYELRTYLRGLLIKSGVSLTPPQLKSTSNGNGHATAHEEPSLGKSDGAEASSAS